VTDARGDDAAKFRALFDLSAVGIQQVALDGTILAVNRKLCDLLGYQDGELLALSVADITHPDDLAQEIDLVERLLSRVDRSYAIDKRQLHKSGAAIWTRVTCSLVDDPPSSGPYLLAVVEDIDARRRAEDDLRRSEARLGSVLDASPDGILVIDDAGIIESVNRACETLFGYAAGELIGRNVDMLMPPPYRERHDGYLARYRDTGRRHIIGVERVVDGQRKDGGTFAMALTVDDVSVAGRRLFIGFARDITRQQGAAQRLKELEAELLHVARVSAMGQLASALAHELTQPLTAAGNYIGAGRRLATTSGVPRERTLAALDKAASQIARAGQIVNRMRSFIEKGETERSTQDVNHAVEEASTLALVGSKLVAVDLILELAPGIPPVLIDRTPIQQVVVNLMRNAVEAMDGTEQRRLTLSTRQVDDAFAEVSVRDTGPGLPAEVAQRLFKPFVSTKSTGMGIGLSICRSIVLAHGGAIRAEPHTDGGTIFSFTLPLAPVGDV